LMAKKHIALSDTHSAEVDLFCQTNLFVLPT